MSIEVHEFGPEDRRMAGLFHRVRWIIQDEEEYFVPERGSEKRDRAREQDLLEPGRTPSSTRLFVAHFKGRPAARLALLPDAGDRSEARFGFFECRNDRRVFDALMARVTDRARNDGASRLVGPTVDTPEGSVGCLRTEPETPPTVLLPHHPRYYWTLFEGYGFGPDKDFYCLETDRDTLQPHPLFNRILRLGGTVADRGDLSMRGFSARPPGRDLASAARLVEVARAAGWGFGPDENVLAAILEEFPREFDPELWVFLLRRERPIGCVLALPDVNRALHELRKIRRPFQGIAARLTRTPVTRLRVIGFGFEPSEARLGTLGALVRDFLTRALDRGFSRSELSVIDGEQTVLRDRLSRLLGARESRNYRRYRLPLRS